MKRIGVIADTHLSESSRSWGLPECVTGYLKGVDFILHAGDFTCGRVMKELEKIAPLVGVLGNNDSPSLGLPRSRRLTVEGVTLGLCHGDICASGFVIPFDQFPGNGTTAANAFSQFEFEEDVACVVFGHSHQPMAQWYDAEDRRVLLFNPGSPTDKRWNKNYGCGVLSVDGTDISGELFLW